MKKLFFLLLLLSTSLQAQIKKMSELSKNKFLDSATIYDDKSDEVWGYLLLYKIDKVSRDFLQLEYIILDKNLNKISSNTFYQDCYDSWIVDIMPKINSVYKNKNELLLAIGFDYDELYTDKPYAFRKISLDDYSISDTFFFINDKKIEDNKVMDRLIAEKDDPTYFTPIKNYGFISRQSHLGFRQQLNASKSKYHKNTIGYTIHDLNFEKIWDYKYTKVENVTEEHHLAECNENYMVFFKGLSGKLYNNKTQYFYRIVNSQDGKELALIPFENGIYGYEHARIVYDNDKIILFGKIFEKDQKGNYSDDTSLGYVKKVVDVKTFKVVDEKIFFWESLSKFKEITKYGKINNSDVVRFLDFKLTTEGKILAVGESYQYGYNYTIVKNIYALEFDSEFNVISMKEFAKSINKIGQPFLYGVSLEAKNLFDFMYSQKINENEFIYFYKDNMKENTKTWRLGVIVYSGGKFQNQKIDLNTESGKIYPFKAKKGYIILKEDTESGPTIRLEKIEY